MKSNIIFLFGLLVIYVISVYRNYKWFQKAYSKSDDPYKDGRWSYSEADYDTIIITFFPIVNTIVTIFNLFDSPYRNKQEENRKNISKIFKVKK
jgi:hypothetical protein